VVGFTIIGRRLAADELFADLPELLFLTGVLLELLLGLAAAADLRVWPAGS